MVIRFISLFTLVFIILIGTQSYAAVTAIADRTVLSINESFNLEINLTEDSSGRPDLTGLERDFSIISQSQSRQMNIINGKSTKKQTWLITLMPKKLGKIVIPAIHIGKESTTAIPLVIHKSSSNLSANKPPSSNNDSTKNLSNEEVFIDVQVSPKDEVYVQQKIDLMIRIYYRIRLSNMALGQLTINDTIMEQVGEDKSYNKVIDKKTYMVVERHYALFPQKSGHLTIPAIRFEGMKSTSSNRGFGGFFSQRGKPVYKQSNPTSLTIKKKPESYTGKHWLPAENIQFSSKHSDLSNIKVGDSITITDKIVAKGILGNILPTIAWPNLKNLKTYPDKATLDSQVNKNDLYGLREEKMAIIPVRAGQYQLPERKLIWWNTLTNQQQEKIIPGISFNVAEAESSISEADQLAIQLAKQDQINQEQQGQQNKELKQAPIKQPNMIDGSNIVEDSNNIVKDSNNIVKDSNIIDHSNSEYTEQNFIGYTKTSQNPWFWIWLISSLALSILLLISLYFVYKKPASNSHAIEKDKPQKNENELIKEIKKACTDKNKSQAYSLINQWLNSQTGVQKVNDKKLKQAIQNLEQSIYSSNAKDWDEQELLKALNDYLGKAKNKNTTEELLALNPL